MANPFDQFDAPASAQANPFDKFDKPAGDQKTALGDLGRKFKSGVEQLPGMVTGLADIAPAIATGTRPFTAAADYLGSITGFTPGKWAKEIQYSDANAQGAKNVDEAWTGIESAQKDPAKTKSDVVRQALADAPKIADAYIRNPMYTAGQIVESVPSMVAGGVASKGLMVVGRVAGVAGAAADAATGLAATAGRSAVPGYLERTVGEKMAAPVAAGLGEGAVTSGQQMDQYEGGDQRRNALASLAAGAGTGAIGVAAGRAAHAMGLETSGTAMARIGDAASDTAEMSAKRRILGGMISESVLQELPQSAQEQVWQNYADGKPLMDGVLRQGIEGALAGAIMGAGANLRGNAEHATDAPLGQADELATTPPSPTPGLPSSPEAEAQPHTQEFNSSAAAPELAQDAAPTVDPALAAGEIPASVPVPTIEDQALDTEAAKRANRLAAVGVADTQPNSPLTNAALAAVDSGAHGAAMAERAATQAPLEAHQPPPVRQQDQAQQAPLAHAAEAVPLADTGTAPAAQNQTSSIVPPSSAPLNSPIAAAPTPQERIAALSAEIASSKDATGKPLNKLQVNMRRTNMRQLISDLPADQIEAARAQHDAPPQELTRATDIATGPARVLQNRDRSTAASIGQMNKIASAPDYLRAGQASVMESGAPVVFGATPKHALVGKEVQITDGTGKRTPVQYAVVEAEDVLPSHQADGTPIAKYQNGVPGKLRAVAGNGRAAGITAGYQRGTAAQYRQDLTNDATDLGVDPQAVSAMKAPVLVRVMPEELVTDDIGDRSNIGGTAALSPTEQATNDTRRIDLRALTFDENGVPDQQSIAQFVQAMPEGERSTLQMPDGSPTRQGIDRITSAAFKAAYGNDEVVRLQAQSTDTEIRNIITAMARVAGPMAGLEGAGDFDVRGAVSEAAQMAVNAKRGGISLTEYLNNADMGFSGEAFTVAQFMAENIRSAKNMADGLRAWVDYAAEQVAIARENQVQDGLFGATPTASRGDTFNQLGATSEQPSAAQISNGASRSSPVEDRAPRQEAKPDAEQNLAGDFEAQSAQVAETVTQQPEGAANEPKADETQPQQAQPATSPSPVPDEVARPDGWRNNRIAAGAVARKLGIDTKGVSLAEVVAAVERADAPAQAAKAKKPTLRESVAQAKAAREMAAQEQAATKIDAIKQFVFSDDVSPVEDGFTRLYRAESPTVGFHDVFNAEGLTHFARPAGMRGKRYSNNKKVADYYRKSYGRDAKIYYIDIPSNKLEQFKVADEEYIIEPGEVLPDTLTAPTPQDIIDQQDRAEAAQAAEIKTKTDAENKAKADEQVGEFALTGSDRAADVGTAGGQEAMFLRNSAKQSANSSKAMASVQTVADRISANWHNAPEIIVATNMADPRIPQAARDEDQRQRAMGATGSPEGFVHGGKVYLLADQLASPERAATVLMHEALGHIGLQGVFGDSLKTILRQISTMRRADTAAKAKQYGLSMDSAADRLTAAEEVLADLAASRPEVGFVRQAVAAIKAWLRVNIPMLSNMDMSDSEIISNFIIPARNWIERGNPAKNGGTGPISVQGRSQSSLWDSDMLGRIVNGPAFSKQGLRGLNIPQQRVVLSIVARAIHDDKIGQGIIQLVPVNVMNNLIGLKDSSYALPNNPSMLKNLTSINSENSVPKTIDEASALVSATAFVTAKQVIRSGERSLSSGINPAMEAFKRQLSASMSSDAGIAAKGKASLANMIGLASKRFPAAGAGKIQDRHVVTPTSGNVIDAPDVDASAASPILPANPDIRFSRSPAAAINARLNDKPETTLGNTGRYDEAQIQAMHNTGMTVTEKSIAERTKEFWQDTGKKLAQGLADQFAPIKEISKEAYGLARLAKGASGAFEALLQGGKLKLTDGVYDFDEAQRGGVVETLLKPMNGEHHDALRWVAANRAEQLMNESEATRSEGAALLAQASALNQQARALESTGKIPEAKKLRAEAEIKKSEGDKKKNVSRENLFTRDDIAALKRLSDGDTSFDYTIQNGVRKGAVTRKRSEIYKDFNATLNGFNRNVLDLTEKSGLIDPESRKVWERDFYVPFYRVSEDDGGSAGGANVSGSMVRQKAFERLKGGKQKLSNDLLDNVLMNWAHLLDASAKNRAAKATLEAAAAMPTPVAIEAPESTVRSIASEIGKKNSVVWFMDSGKQRYFIVDDPYVLTAITALEYAGMRNPVMNAMGAFKHILTVGVTASPFFKIRNLIRDSLQVVASAPLDYNVAKNIKQGFALTNPRSDAYFRLLAGGGTIHFGTMMEGSEGKRVQSLVESGVKESSILNSDQKVKAFYRKFIEPGVTAYNELGNRGEAINRAALYDQLIKQGVSHGEASLQARDLMDFSMQGSFTSIRFLTQVVPFLNARIQGLYKLGRAAKEDPRRMAAVLGATAGFSLLLLAAYSDDDDWKKREEFDRNNFWWFKFGGEAFRIPKPFEIGAMATLAERGFELAFSKEMTSKRFMEQVRTLLSDNLSMSPIPQMFKPVIDVYANKDSFSGRPIEGMGMDKLRPEYRFSDRTSMLARGASSALNAAAGVFDKDSLSPVQIDHMLRGYFGWLGSFVVGTSEIIARPATNQPTQAAPDYWKMATGGIASKLDGAQSRYVSSMYEQASRIEQDYGTWRAMIKEGKPLEAQEYRAENAESIGKYHRIEAAKKQTATLNQQIKIIERGNVSSTEKRERITAMRNQQNLIAKMAMSTE